MCFLRFSNALNVRSVLHSVIWIRLLHLIYDIGVMLRKTGFNPSISPSRIERIKLAIMKYGLNSVQNYKTQHE